MIQHSREDKLLDNWISSFNFSCSVATCWFSFHVSNVNDTNCILLHILNQFCAMVVFKHYACLHICINSPATHMKRHQCQLLRLSQLSQQNAHCQYYWQKDWVPPVEISKCHWPFFYKLYNNSNINNIKGY